MTTTSARLGLRRHTTGDSFHIDDYTHNWDILDEAPGIKSGSSLPSAGWGLSNVGQFFFRTSDDTLWRWDGTQFLRAAPKGLLGQEYLASSFGTSSTGWQTAITLAFNAQGGGRQLMVVVDVPKIINTNGVVDLAVWMNTSGDNQFEWQSGHPTSAFDRDASKVVIIDPGGVNFGSRLLSLKIRATAAYGGVTTITAPASISVVEV